MNRYIIQTSVDSFLSSFVSYVGVGLRVEFYWCWISFTYSGIPPVPSVLFVPIDPHQKGWISSFFFFFFSFCTNLWNKIATPKKDPFFLFCTTVFKTSSYSTNIPEYVILILRYGSSGLTFYPAYWFYLFIYFWCIDNWIWKGGNGWILEL